MIMNTQTILKEAEDFYQGIRYGGRPYVSHLTDCIAIADSLRVQHVDGFANLISPETYCLLTAHDLYEDGMTETRLNIISGNDEKFVEGCKLLSRHTTDNYREDYLARIISAIKTRPDCMLVKMIDLSANIEQCIRDYAKTGETDSRLERYGASFQYMAYKAHCHLNIEYSQNMSRTLLIMATYVYEQQHP